MRVEIIGNIASGKTTLAKIMGECFYSNYENFQENPFWKDFYSDPSFYSFETELTFTLQHYHQIKNHLRRRNKNAIFDFSLLLDRSYADVTLQGDRKNIYIDVLNELLEEVGHPDFIIYIKCSENVLLNRIKARGRQTEESITTDYLISLTESINSNIDAHNGNTQIITVDSELIDYAHDSDCANKVIKSVCNKIEQHNQT